MEKILMIFKKELGLNEINDMTKVKISLKGIVEASFKVFDISLKKLHLENEKFLENSVNATLQLFYVVGLFDRLQEKMKCEIINPPSIQVKEGN